MLPTARPARTVDGGPRAPRRRMMPNLCGDGEERRGSEVQCRSPRTAVTSRTGPPHGGPNCLARSLMGKAIVHQTAGGYLPDPLAVGGSQGSQWGGAQGHERARARYHHGRCWEVRTSSARRVPSLISACSAFRCTHLRDGPAHRSRVEAIEVTGTVAGFTTRSDQVDRSPGGRGYREVDDVVSDVPAEVHGARCAIRGPNRPLRGRPGPRMAARPAGRGGAGSPGRGLTGEGPGPESRGSRVAKHLPTAPTSGSRPRPVATGTRRMP